MINLKEIIKKHSECLSNSERFKAIVLDLFPDEKLYCNILSIMIQDGFVDEIRTKQEIDLITKNRIKRSIKKSYGFADKYVEECLNLWADAFGIKIQKEINQSKHLHENVQLEKKKSKTIEEQKQSLTSQNKVSEVKYKQSVIKTILLITSFILLMLGISSCTNGCSITNNYKTSDKGFELCILGCILEFVACFLFLAWDNKEKNQKMQTFLQFVFWCLFGVGILTCTIVSVLQ